MLSFGSTAQSAAKSSAGDVLKYEKPSSRRARRNPPPNLVSNIAEVLWFISTYIGKITLLGVLGG